VWLKSIHVVCHVAWMFVLVFEVLQLCYLRYVLEFSIQIVPFSTVILCYKLLKDIFFLCLF
jgi:hypothetical protein